MKIYISAAGAAAPKQAATAAVEGEEASSGAGPTLSLSPQQQWRARKPLRGAGPTLSLSPQQQWRARKPLRGLGQLCPCRHSSSGGRGSHFGGWANSVPVATAAVEGEEASSGAGPTLSLSLKVFASLRLAGAKVQANHYLCLAGLGCVCVAR